MSIQAARRLVAVCAGSLWLCSASADRIDDLVIAEMQRQSIPGLSIAIVKDGKIVREQGYGLANLEHAVPVTPDTVFQSGSVGKPFIAALTMLLVEDGAIQLDEPIATYLPGTPEAWAKITVRHLLNHTSGLAGGDPSIDIRRDYSEQQLLESMSKLPLRFAPGEQWGYGHLGYQVLGFLCSAVGGKFYGDQLRQRIFEPAGMGASIISERTLVPHRAAGYDRVDGVLVNQQWVAPSLNTTADGSLHVTARDLARWSIALDGDKVLSSSIKEVSWTPAKLNDGRTVEYGLGWELGTVNGHRFAQHGGASQGFTTLISRYLDDGLTVIVLTNRSRARPQTIAEKIVGQYIPDLRVDVPTTTSFVSVPMFLRGSMNEWSVRDRLRPAAEGVYETEIELEPGRHLFRVASEDWSTIDFGAPIDDPSMELEKARPLEFKGENLMVSVPQRARYVFRFDVRKPSNPSLAVNRRGSQR